MATISIKASKGEDMRRFNISPTYAELTGRLTGVYQLDMTTKYLVKYLDDENDRVTMANDEDLQAAIQMRQDLGATGPLRVFVTLDTPTPMEQEAHDTQAQEKEDEEDDDEDDEEEQQHPALPDLADALDVAAVNTALGQAGLQELTPQQVAQMVLMLQVKTKRLVKMGLLKHGCLRSLPRKPWKEGWRQHSHHHRHHRHHRHLGFGKGKGGGKGFGGGWGGVAAHWRWAADDEKQQQQAEQQQVEQQQQQVENEEEMLDAEQEGLAADYTAAAQPELLWMGAAGKGCSGKGGWCGGKGKGKGHHGKGSHHGKGGWGKGGHGKGGGWHQLALAAAAAGADEDALDVSGGWHRKSAARFVKHVSLEDGAVLVPGAAATKTWRVRNDSQQPWPQHVQLLTLSAEGRALGAPETVDVRGSVAPGAEADVSVPLVAPAEPGLYQAFWKLREQDGAKFGQRLWVQLQVVDPNAANTTGSDSDGGWQQVAGMEEAAGAEPAELQPLMQSLREMGFCDEAENRRLLLKSKMNVEKVVHKLSKQQAKQQQQQQ